MTPPGLLALDPIMVPKPWGGTRLADLGKTPPAHPPSPARYGESWEVADLPDSALGPSKRGRTCVADGPHRGKTLRRLIAEHGTALLGSASPTSGGDFPLLFKLLDTSQHLSIQVHPDEIRAATHPAWQPKTESWYVIEAEPDAVIYKGFRPRISVDEVRSTAGTSDLVHLLQPVTVQRGDFHHLPAGTVHALGAGITVAEVQTPSDTTFRLYDWTEEYDRPPRQLQIGPALDALMFESPPAPSQRPMAGEGVRLLVDTPHYWIREHRSSKLPMPVRDVPELRILAVVDGRVVVQTDTSPPMELGKGSTVVIPAAVATSTTAWPSGSAVALEIGL